MGYKANTPADLSFPFGGSICFQVETSYGSGVVTGAALVISDAVTDVRLETGDVNTTLRTISSPSVADFSTTLVSPKLHVEWILQPNIQASAFESFCLDRVNCDLRSMAIQVGVNTCSSTSDIYYNCKGAKCDSFTISSTQGDNWKCSADFTLASVATAAATICTLPSALGSTTYAYAAFNTAGSIYQSGSVASAYITKAFSITVNNNLSDLYTVGSSAKRASIPGAYDVTGSCDISIDKGGYLIWPQICAGTNLTTLVFNTGLTSGQCGKWTLNNGRFDSLGIDLSTAGEAMISSVPFKFKNLKLSKGT